jgi:ectoine hydroxylase-related dioxygenase (phytanoyl-CoA dioxygenase family)
VLTKRCALQSHYICKPAGDGEAVHWHQDGKGWPVFPKVELIPVVATQWPSLLYHYQNTESGMSLCKDPMVTLWLAVDNSDEENGCLRIIPYTVCISALTNSSVSHEYDPGCRIYM